MLRDTSHIEQPHLCWQNSLQETYGEVKSERENGTRDLNPPVAKPRPYCQFSQLLRGLHEYIHHT